MKSISLKDSSAFRLLGSDVCFEAGFHRLSGSERETMKTVNPGVSWHALHSAGIQALFETDSRTLRFHVTLMQSSTMSNMAPSGHSGIDLYVVGEDGQERLLDVANVPSDAPSYTVEFGHFSDLRMRRYRLHLPVYNAALNIDCEIDDVATIVPSAPAKMGRIAVYGTSIVQGGSVSRPGMMLTNILSRWRNQEFLNFGFSGSALCEVELATMIGSRADLRCLVIDVEANAGTDERLRDRLTSFLDAFRTSYPNLPILLVSRIGFAMDVYDAVRAQWLAYYRTWLKDYARSERNKGHKVAFLNAGAISAESTVDGIHPSDLGMLELAKKYRSALERLC
ncbi:MAG: SGNH/GDSL hydrolase family protein [Bacillus subtilis]|nr:SGNH/GDSL hydrolase family protein [Bacillus subtilis]